MRTREWRRPMLGLALGLVLALAGPVGSAIGWLSQPVGLYSHPIPYRADVGVFAYAEGRVEVRARFSQERAAERCWDEYDCEMVRVVDTVEVIAARGAGAIARRDASAAGQVNPATVPGAATQGQDHEGETRFVSAMFSSCDDNGDCDDRWVSSGEQFLETFELDVDPRLRSASLHAVLFGDEGPVTIDGSWTADGPMEPGDSGRSHQSVDARPGADADVHREQTIGRAATATVSLHGWAPDPDQGTLESGRIFYATTQRARANVQVPARPPCIDQPPVNEACDL